MSIDTLAVGFALGTFHVSLALAAATIGGISVSMSLIGYRWRPDQHPRRRAR